MSLKCHKSQSLKQLQKMKKEEQEEYFPFSCEKWLFSLSLHLTCKTWRMKKWRARVENQILEAKMYLWRYGLIECSCKGHFPLEVAFKYFNQTSWIVWIFSILRDFNGFFFLKKKGVGKVFTENSDFWILKLSKFVRKFRNWKFNIFPPKVD